MLKDVRLKFLNYFKSKNHFVQESFSLVPKNDPSLLFVNSGMAPMKPFFLNEVAPPSKLVVSSQRCVRVGGKHNDLADIGYSKRHHTFFEMLGNFSFGGYFKSEAIDFAWEFLVSELELDANRLFISVHPEDLDAFNFWLKHVDASKITKLNANVWKMGDVGPWGYCSEIFYDLQVGDGDLENGDRFLEIWNIVFTQFCFDGVKDFNLDFPCIDAGMGLERIVSVLEGKNDNYEINFFKKPLACLGLVEHNFHSKVFLDHLRSVSFLIMDGVVPSSSLEGYVLRRLIRRMLRSFYSFNLDLIETVKAVFEVWKDEYSLDFEKVISVLKVEDASFKNTIDDGVKRFFSMLKDGFLSAENMFSLHDTYGLTFDIVNDLLQENNASADFDGFHSLMAKAKERNCKDSTSLDFPDTVFVELGSDDCLNGELASNLIGIYDKFLVFDRSIFYAEGGGQVGDSGFVFGDGFKAKIVDTKKVNKVFIHEFELIEGVVALGPVTLQLNVDRRFRISAHHSTTHLLQYVLEKLYGGEIKQMGSLVNEFKFREDFSCSADFVDISLIESEINKIIVESMPSEFMYMSLSEARKIGAKAFFEYEDLVRVAKIGPSLELCGGTHIMNTADIFAVKMMKVSTVKNGVKRFEGMSGRACLDYLLAKERLFDEGMEFLQCSNMDGYMNSLKKLAEKKVPAALKFSAEVKGFNVGIIHGNEDDSLENLMAQFKLDIGCLYLEKETKCNIKLRSTVSAVSAKVLIQGIASSINSKGGGGNAELAQTGGEKQKDLKAVFDTLISLL